MNDKITWLLSHSCTRIVNKMPRKYKQPHQTRVAPDTSEREDCEREKMPNQLSEVLWKSRRFGLKVPTIPKTICTRFKALFLQVYIFKQTFLLYNILCLSSGLSCFKCYDVLQFYAFPLQDLCDFRFFWVIGSLKSDEILSVGKNTFANSGRAAWKIRGLWWIFRD